MILSISLFSWGTRLKTMFSASSTLALLAAYVYKAGHFIANIC
ncbi:MAG: hypothetical protein ACJAVV_002135 [Alphaproteobacteria bacterium]|jgi:hypothetical protein